VEQLNLAIDTSKLDDWPERVKYSKIEHLLGTDDKVDSWLRIAKASPPKPGDEEDWQVRDAREKAEAAELNAKQQREWDDEMGTTPVVYHDWSKL
jgi:hypothetical protein